MGLDMYLVEEKYFSGSEYMMEEPSRRDEVHRAKALMLAADVEVGMKCQFPSVEVTVTVAYWRKANAVHQWFVENVQGGIDNCDAYEVSVDQLHELRDICRQIDINHSLAPKLLPTQSGFFFGTTDYNEWYYEDVSSTIEQLDRVLEHHKKTAGRWSSFKYRASW